MNEGRSTNNLWKGSIVARLALLLVVSLLLAGVVRAQEGERPEAIDDGPDIPPVEILKQEPVPGGVNIAIQIPVSKDSYIASAQPNSNFGGLTTTRIGYEAGGRGAMRIVLQFDLSSIPSNVTINSAEFAYYLAQSSPVNDAPMPFLAQFMNAAWSEYGVTWNNASYLGGPSLPIGEVPGTVGWHSSDGTAAVRAWHSGTRPNYGVMITGDERPDQNRSRLFYSREQSGFFPRLIVDYTVSCDTVAPVATVTPLPTYSPGSFEVKWSGTDTAPSGCTPSGIASYDVQYRVNGGSWVNWKQETTELSGTIQSGANNSLYEFRARAVDEAGNVQAFSAVQASTRVDTLPPAVAVRDLATYTFTSSFFVHWDGSDNLSGIESFDAQWRKAGGVWQTLVENTALRSFEFTGAQNGVTYQFRARARDRVGNVQPYSDQAQAQTTVVTHPIATVLPFDPVVLKSTAPITDTFTVSWQFVSGPTTPDETRIFYRYDGGAWQLWDVFDYPQLNALFYWEDMGLGDGIYEFEAVAINTIGQVEPQAQQAEATIWVDMADVVHPRAYHPSVVRGP
jgi:hypothetical protein